MASCTGCKSVITLELITKFHLALIPSNVLEFQKSIKKIEHLRGSLQGCRYYVTFFRFFKPMKMMSLKIDYVILFTCFIKKGRQPFSIKSILKMFSRENSKLCFEQLKMNSAPQNNLPCRELENASEVGVLLKLELETG